MQGEGVMNSNSSDRMDNRNTISFIRYPIFKKNRQLWGYRVRCIDRRGDAAHLLSGEGDVSDLVSSSSCMGLERLLSKGKSLMVDLGQESLLKAVFHYLPSENSVIRVSEKVDVDNELLSALEGLKSDGYRLAVSRFSGKKELSGLYDLADILCLKTGGKNREELGEMTEPARHFKSRLMGEQVGDGVHFDRCSDLGFSLFQGGFFKSPEKISVRKISSNEAARFRLMKIIEVDEPDLEALAKEIQSDVTISLRLLTYLNSATFGFRSKISSIKQAINMLGWENMKKWLRVVVLSDVSKQTHAQDLVLLSSQRGKFLEKLVQDHDFWDFSPDSLFLLGVFSLLDALLDMPMEKVVEHLPLEEHLKAALLRSAGSEYEPFLQLAEHLEEADWDAADRMIQRLSMNAEMVKDNFHAAVEWADSMICMHE
jgi:EAL and modified HD-GYP domain-containing signal transduction protein